ncbi:MAG: hypothetical protein ACXWCM_13260 [Acidimicrobiales bacterium]
MPQLEPDAIPSQSRRPIAGGRQGSPTITLALPFSRVRVEANDLAFDALAELTELVAQIAEVSAGEADSARSEELTRLAGEARGLARRIHPRDPSA